MTGKSQSEAVAVLRAIPPSSLIALIVSRQIVDDADIVTCSDTVGIFCFLEGRGIARFIS